MSNQNATLQSPRKSHDPFNRRNFIFASSGAAAGALTVPGLLEAEEVAATSELDYSSSGLVTGQLKPLKLKEIPGFLSAAQIAPHHTAHYGGALKAVVAADSKLEESLKSGTPTDPAAFAHLKRLINSRGNSVVLHECYFDGLSTDELKPGDSLRSAIESRFGSMAKWADDFIGRQKKPLVGQCS